MDITIEIPYRLYQANDIGCVGSAHIEFRIVDMRGMLPFLVRCRSPLWEPRTH